MNPGREVTPTLSRQNRLPLPSPAGTAQMRGLRARPVVRQVKKLPRPIHVSPHTPESSVISDSTRALARNLD
ncbi:hypothetical protein CEXT_178291 [Caerostris extrusa]|uniref:Uncharacterized protein n=1 Tax=Caerostris extrusa TaxID=172846 RepID=A0AAV4QPH1_CAEEX|nr:hypothetical protein CEXT_178291 [Caerostris extrusa]